jgi:hypothetical protein
MARRACRRAGVPTQRPFTRCMPAPHASRTLTIMSPECGSGAGGIACAEEPKPRAKATAMNRIIVPLPSAKGQSVAGIAASQGSRRNFLSTIGICLKWRSGFPEKRGHRGCKPSPRPPQFGATAPILAAKKPIPGEAGRSSYGSAHSSSSYSDDARRWSRALLTSRITKIVSKASRRFWSGVSV